MRLLFCTLLVVFGLIAAPSEGSAQPRVALVIGNGNYQNVSALPNPINDANDISASLKRLGFDVKTLVNAKFDDMRRALIDFGRQARGAEIAIIFFAGHGMEIGGENWLIPVDAQLTTDLDVSNETIGLQSLTRAVSNTTKLGLVILDACRNNPFLPKMQRTNLTRAVDRGLARIEPNDNVLVAYSARDGTTAKDGSGRNSPFTSSLLKNIETPGLDVRFLFASVRDDVMAATKREQQPFVYGSLSKEMIYLDPPVATTTNLPSSGTDHTAAIIPSGPSALLSGSERKPEIKLTSRSPLQGAVVSVIPTETAYKLHLGAGSEGVIITQLPKDSKAATLGFAKGDVILKINDKSVRVSNIEQATRMPLKVWRITLVRNGDEMSVALSGSQ